jgi:hypothetical protein
MRNRFCFKVALLIAGIGVQAASAAGQQICKAALQARDMTNLESCAQHGHGNVICTRQPGSIRGSATWVFEIREDGQYNVQIKYASKENRPIEVSVDNRERDQCCGGTTGSWHEGSAQTVGALTVDLSAGTHEVTIWREDAPIPIVSVCLEKRN